MTNQVIAPGVRTNARSKGAATTAIGAVLTYTTPTNKRAEITAYAFTSVDAGVEIDAEFVAGANAFQIEDGGSGASVIQRSCRICLDPGQSFRGNCTAAMAASSADLYISVMEEA